MEELLVRHEHVLKKQDPAFFSYLLNSLQKTQDDVPAGSSANVLFRSGAGCALRSHDFLDEVLPLPPTPSVKSRPLQAEPTHYRSKATEHRTIGEYLSISSSDLFQDHGCPSQHIQAQSYPILEQNASVPLKESL